MLSKFIGEFFMNLLLKKPKGAKWMKTHFFGTADYFFQTPQLTKDQKESYRRFLYEDIDKAWKKVFPVQDANKKYSLSYHGVTIGEPNFSPEESIKKKKTYSVPLRGRFILYDNEVKNAIESEVFIGNIPLMTEQGSFIYNGIDKTIVAQIVRANGVYLEEDTNQKWRKLKIKISPKKGSWLIFEADRKGTMNVRIDDGKNIPVTMFLKALGLGDEEFFLEKFDNHPFIQSSIEKDVTENQGEAALQVYQIIKGQIVSKEKAIEFISNIFFEPKKYELGKTGRYKLNKKLGLFERAFGKVLAKEVDGFGVGTVITKEVLESLSVSEVYVFGEEDDIIHIIGNDQNVMDEVLNKEDIFAALNYCLYAEKVGVIDNIDHLSNRQVRLVGDILLKEYEKAIAAIERKVKEKLNTSHSLDTNNKDEALTPESVIFIRPIITAMRESLATSQLSQNLDQVNVLSEIEHKRRTSALGPGGFTKERAGLEVRDVNTSHYGRFCPVQTPEGQNIGLILELAMESRVNEYGLLETPYRKVDKKTGLATKTVDYLTAEEEEKYKIARATDVDKKGRFIEEVVIVRHEQNYIHVPNNEVDYVDVTPRQIFSVATSLIPFVHNDDPTRTVMGSNMQKQAMPLLRPQEPWIGTGIEQLVATDTGASYIAEENGIVVKVDAKELVVKYDSLGEKTYVIKKFRRTSKDTCFNHRVLVTKGQKVTKDQVLVDSTSSNNGELALGQNVVVAFMTWEGYNYEDAIIISDRLVQDDVYTSLTMGEYIVDVRETKAGAEEVTREVVNLPENDKRNLDDDGVIKVGSKVEEGDVLVGKNSPKASDETSASEKFLQQVFAEKSKHFKDTSLRVPHGTKGVVSDVHVLTRDDADLPIGVIKQFKITITEKRKIQRGDKMAGRHGNKGVISKVVRQEDMPYLEDGTPVDIMLNPQGVPSRMNIGQLMEVHLGMSARSLQMKYKIPAFDGPDANQLQDELIKAELPENGKFTLYDGRSGKAFENEVTVGVMYILKLDHQVEDKMHARSTGPYSLVHQQPLGGKAQNGGQRLGEMEVWALEAHGASNLLREMVTVKSDDIRGRSKIFQDIVDGRPLSKPNVPEGFNVLIRTIRSLGLDIDAKKEDGTSIYEKKRFKKGE